MNILLSLLVSSVYIFNAQGQYLCIGEDGTPMLSDAPVSLDVTRVDEVADAGRFDLDYTGMKWILKPSAEHTYTLGYQVGEANATTFVYVRSGAMATTFEEPDATFLDGQWAVSTGEESQPILLDETADYVCPLFYKQHVDVTLQRSLVAQEWNTPACRSRCTRIRSAHFGVRARAWLNTRATQVPSSFSPPASISRRACPTS